MNKFSVLFVCLLAIFSCNKPIDKNPVEPDEVTPILSPDSVYVSLKANLSFSEEPLTKAGAADDLYGIRVYQFAKTANPQYDFTETRYAAYGTFDDLSKAVIKMAKAYKYGVVVTYIPNGKNLVHKFADGHYGVPFDAVHVANGALNQVMYCTLGTPAWDFTSGAVQEKGITDYMIQSNNWSSVTRYQGLAICNPAEESSVSVDLFAEMIGFRIEVSDFSEGIVTLFGSYGHKYTITPETGNKALLDAVICRENMPSFCDGGYLHGEESEWVQSIYDEYDRRTMNVSISYTDPSGDEVVLYSNPYFTTQRNTRYIMSFSLSDAISNGGIVVHTVNEGEMKEVGFPF